MRLSDANQFLELTDAGGEMKVSGIRVSVDSEHAGAEALPALKNRIELELEKADALFVKTETWREARATLLNAVKAEKIIVSIILGVVILFAGFMIFIILTVQVVEKGRDIGILQSIGATSGGVANLFFFAARRAGMRLARRLTATVVMMMKARSSARNFTGIWSR